MEDNLGYCQKKNREIEALKNKLGMNHLALIFIVTFPVSHWDEICCFKSSCGVIKELKTTAGWFLYDRSQWDGCDHCPEMRMDAREGHTEVSRKWFHPADTRRMMVEQNKQERKSCLSRNGVEVTQSW